MLAYVAGEVTGSLRCSDAQAVHADVAGFGLVLLPFLLIFNLEEVIL